MNKKELIIILTLLIIIFALCIGIFNSLNHETAIDTSNSSTRELIANESIGSVEVIRNIGNASSKKIAYVVGVHPLENQTHRTLVKMLPNMSDFKYSYDIYIINVTDGIGSYGDGFSDDENPGRQNGQNLAYKYVYPEIVNGSYDLAIDVHSNVGAYDFKTFVFSPLKEGLGAEYANKIAASCQNISYYSPDSTTSGPYLTIPLNENGVPAFYFEEYSFAPQDLKDEHMMELIQAVDNLNI